MAELRMALAIELRDWLETLAELGSLQPGDILPPQSKIGEIFKKETPHINYAEAALEITGTLDHVGSFYYFARAPEAVRSPNHVLFALLSAICLEKLSSSQALPTLRSICNEFHLSKATCFTRVLAPLEQEGVVHRANKRLWLTPNHRERAERMRARFTCQKPRHIAEAQRLLGALASDLNGASDTFTGWKKCKRVSNQWQLAILLLEQFEIVSADNRSYKAAPLTLLELSPATLAERIANCLKWVNRHCRAYPNDVKRIVSISS